MKVYIVLTSTAYGRRPFLPPFFWRVGRFFAASFLKKIGFGTDRRTDSRRTEGKKAEELIL
jgi:hypothetical protein